MEIQCVEIIKNSDQIIEEAYFAANPDVAKSGMGAREHFENHGKYEPVRVQFLNTDDTLQLRREKLPKIVSIVPYICPRRKKNLFWVCDTNPKLLKEG